jgi:hypothetical protein
VALLRHSLFRKRFPVPTALFAGGSRQWRSHPLSFRAIPGKPPAHVGTDFIIVQDGKITAVDLFLNELT